MAERKNAYAYEELIACGRGELFGPGNAQLPLPPILMFDRITQIDDTTREFARATVQTALEANAGISAAELSRALQESRAFSPDRALMIARTESAIAVNHGAVIGYRAAGYDKVEVSDGDGDEDCAAVDGAIWTIEEAMANPIAHPNCTRSFSPYVEE